MTFIHMFLSALTMLFLISLLILIHEAGHFLAAKMVGIRVDKFGFGLPFGPTLFSKKAGDVEILVHAFLLGGYVSFPDDEEECDLPKDSPLRYCNKSLLQRAFVVSAGVICNVLLAYVLIFLTGALWKHLPDNKFIIKFENYAQIASDYTRQSGFQKGDTIYKINGTEIYYPIAINKFFSLSKEFDGFVDKKIVDKKLEELKSLNPKLKNNDIIKAGTVINLPEFTDENPINLSIDNIIGLEKYKNNETDLTNEQKILRDKINYQSKYKLERDTNINDIAFAISDTKKPISIVVLRDNKEIELNKVYSNKEGVLGIEQSFVEKYTETKTLKELIKGTFNYVNYNTAFMIYTLGKLFTGKIPMSEMNGIIAIAKVGTEIIAYKGIFEGLLLTAMISLNLAIINILPIPALDGGHLLFIIIEKITGKPVSKKFVEYVSNFFFYLLILLMIIIIYNDIHAWIIGKI